MAPGGWGLTHSQYEYTWSILDWQKHVNLVNLIKLAVFSACYLAFTNTCHVHWDCSHCTVIVHYASDIALYLFTLLHAKRAPAQ